MPKKHAKKKKAVKHLDPNTVLFIKQVMLGVLMFGFLGMLGTGIWYGTRIDKLTIDNVVVQGGETIPHDELRRIALQKLEGEYFGFIPRTFAFTYPEGEITEALSQFERIEDFSVNRSSGKTVVIQFSEYKPDSLWCGREERSQCYFLDKNGYAFSKAPNLLGGSFIRFFGSDADLQIGVQAIETADYTKAKELIRLLKVQNWFVYGLEVDAAHDAFLFLTDGGELKTSLLTNPIETVENLLTILTSQEFEHIQPGNFVYIDLRFGNKVFVKEFPDVIESATSTDEVVE